MTEQATYTNPVYPEYFADPFVLRAGDRYFAYASDLRDPPAGRRVPLLTSTDLVHWGSLGGALEPVDDPGARHYWAPEVIEHDGTFFMYYSAGVEDRGHRIRVATADRPDGPFRDSGRILTPDEPFAIDAHPLIDDDGAWYLYYARDFLEGERPGTALVVDRLLDPYTLAGERRTVLRASADWQIYQRDREMYGRRWDWHTLEGAFVVKRQGRYWCFYSGGSWLTAEYGVSVAVSESPLGPFVEPSAPGPTLLRAVPDVALGPGHNSIVTGPDGHDWLAYHAWDPGLTARRFFIDRLEWTADGPRTIAPTTTPQRVPVVG